jgi:hypothetical protein
MRQEVYSQLQVPVSYETLSKGEKVTFPVLLNSLRIELCSNIVNWAKSRRRGITVMFFDASSANGNEIGRYIFQDYLGDAFASGRFRVAPPCSWPGPASTTFSRQWMLNDEVYPPPRS